MNEHLLYQIVANKPNISHNSGARIDNLDELYHACLLLNPKFGELEIDDNAKPDDVYLILTSFLTRNDLVVESYTAGEGLCVRFEYAFPIRAEFVDITDFYKLKSIDLNLFETILACIYVLSQFCHNSLFTLDVCEDYIMSCEDEIEDTDSKEELFHSLDMIKNQQGLHDDLETCHNRDNIAFLARSFQKDGVHWSLFLQKLVSSILLNNSLWEKLVKSSFDAVEDEDGNCDYISFLEYTGFKFSNEYTFYEDYHHSHLQSFYEEGNISGNYIFNGEDVRNMYCLKKYCQTFYRAVDLVGVVLQEVENA